MSAAKPSRGILKIKRLDDVLFGRLRTYADPPYIPRLKDVGFTAFL